MQEKRVFLRSVILLSLLLCTSLTLIQIKPITAADPIIVPDHYTSIQEAINHALVNDVIQINPPNDTQQAYYENVIVNKTLTIIGNLTHPETVIVDGNANGPVFELNATNIRIAGLTIRNAGNANPAIEAEHDVIDVRSDYHIIEKNILTTSQYGVYFCYSDNNKILNNTFINNPFDGIMLTYADNTNITGNIITDSAYGIQTTGSLNTKIINNTINQTTWGIYLTGTSTGATIQGNRITGQTTGIFSNSNSTTIDHNTITNSAYAIYLQNNRLNPVTYNTLKGNSFGMRIYYYPATASSHTISNNLIQANDYGILLQYAAGNTFKGNWIQENTWGAFIEFAGSNVFTRNNFINNNLQVAPGTLSNTWNQSGLGNHWSDHTTPDAAPPYGIVDTTYRISPGTDYLPLTYSWSEHDIEIRNVTTSTNEVTPGTPVDITVTVRNRANTSVAETFNVTVYGSTTPIQTQTISWEYIYRDLDSNNKVSVGDTRLNRVGTYPAGSTVAIGNTDINQSLVTFASNEKHRDSTSNSKYDPGEYIYRDLNSDNKVSIGDIRLTQVGLYLAGSIVATGNSDLNQNLIPFASNEKHRENVITNGIYEPGLMTGTTVTLTFNWNASGVPPGNYTISAEASTVVDELNSNNNNFTYGTVRVIQPLVGDINNDGIVNEQDLTIMVLAYGSTFGSPNWNPQADLNDDDIIDTQDLMILGKNYGNGT